MRSLLLSTLFISVFGFSQNQDAQLWTGLGLKANIGKKLSLKYETQTRFYKNASTLRTYYNELSVGYEVVKNLSLGTSYRYSRKDKEGYFAGENRVCINADYAYKIAETGLRFKTRARYQLAFDRVGVINDVIYPNVRSTFRWKFDLKYRNADFKRVMPFVGYELFKAIQPAGFSGIDAYRIYAGIDFDLPKRHELGIKYIYELDYGTQQNITHNYVIQYNYSLPSKLFKKKKD
jgi:long-subunit fatty acid transport protein